MIPWVQIKQRLQGSFASVLSLSGRAGSVPPALLTNHQLSPLFPPAWSPGSEHLPFTLDKAAMYGHTGCTLHNPRGRHCVGCCGFMESFQQLQANSNEMSPGRGTVLLHNGHLVPFAAWMELETLILSEVSQKEKDKYPMFFDG